MTQLPQELLQRVERVLAFHESTKLHAGQVVPAMPNDPAQVPGLYRVFSGASEVRLPTTLLDAPTGVLSLLEQGREALPESHTAPPQDLKTLATWLFLSNGLIPIKRKGRVVNWLRTCPSIDNRCPFEIYVAAFAINGLSPGLYHYQPREFRLRKLRDGAETLALIRRGRPDLEFVRNIPAALLVNSVFSRSTPRFAARGYRVALLDSGQLIENVAVSGNALGIQTMTRLRMNLANMNELIGVNSSTPFASAEAVQGMVMWVDPATHPQAIEPYRAGTPLPPIERAPLAPNVVEYPQIITVNSECLSPNTGVAELRPPYTETYPLSPEAALRSHAVAVDPPAGKGLFRVLANRRAAPGFVPQSVPRATFLQVNQAAFRGGTYHPLSPDGPHVALVRPYWLILDVTGIEQGVWYYHPPIDRWALLMKSNIRKAATLLAMNSPFVANAAAVCVMAANIPDLSRITGMDVYRLSHLEAGIAAQRLHLAANALDLGCRVSMSFYDNELRKFLGLEFLGWEPISIVSLGVSVDDAATPQHPNSPESSSADGQGDLWRG